jgi:VWFA-related protein
VDWITDFTSDREQFEKRLLVQEGWGQTALHDAVAATPRLVDSRLKGRRAIVLITDGVDNFSRITPAEAVKLARQVSVPVYTLGFLSAPEARRAGEVQQPGSLEMLRHLSAETGGRLLTVDTPQEMGLAAIQVADELRHQYLIGYYTRRDDGGFRPIRLELPDRPRLAVRTRSGFVATP